jgi:DNA-binding MarR family transcriptional regulator
MATTRAQTQNQDNTALVRELGNAIRRFRARLRTESKSTKSKSTIAQSDLLSSIIEIGPTTIQELANRRHIRPQSIAETVTELRAEGLIRSEKSLFDRRKVLLSVTAKGKKRVKLVYSARAWLGKVMNETLSKDEIDILAKAITILERLADYKDD